MCTLILSHPSKNISGLYPPTSTLCHGPKVTDSSPATYVPQVQREAFSVCCLQSPDSLRLWSTSMLGTSKAQHNQLAPSVYRFPSEGTASQPSTPLTPIVSWSECIKLCTPARYTKQAPSVCWFGSVSTESWPCTQVAPILS